MIHIPCSQPRVRPMRPARNERPATFAKHPASRFGSILLIMALLVISGFRTISFSYSASVLVVVPIQNIMTAVFNRPMLANGVLYHIWGGFLGRPACNSVYDFAGNLARFFLYGFSFYHKRLGDMGKIQISVQFACCPNTARFYAAVFPTGNIEIFRFRVDITKKELDVGTQGSLVVFRNQKIMSLSPTRDVIGKTCLGVQSVDRYVFTFYVESVEQRDDYLDLVGLLLFVRIFADGQRAYFFWV